MPTLLDEPRRVHPALPERADHEPTPARIPYGWDNLDLDHEGQPPVEVEPTPGPLDGLDWTEDGEPFARPFEPTEGDLAYWTAFCAARNGEPGRIDKKGRFYVGDAVMLRWCRGTAEGTKARESAEAYDLGYALGLTTGISEAPLGYAAHERNAFAQGFSDAAHEVDAEFHAQREADAWDASIEFDRQAEAFGGGVRDEDVYPSGCVS